MCEYNVLAQTAVYRAVPTLLSPLSDLTADTCWETLACLPQINTPAAAHASNRSVQWQAASASSGAGHLPELNSYDTPASAVAAAAENATKFNQQQVYLALLVSQRGVSGMHAAGVLD